METYTVKLKLYIFSDSAKKVNFDLFDLQSCLLKLDLWPLLLSDVNRKKRDGANCQILNFFYLNFINSVARKGVMVYSPFVTY